MVYLLQDTLTPSTYILMERTDEDEELFYNDGMWKPQIPTTFKNINPDIVKYKNGKPINWWCKAYQDAVDAKVVVRRKTQEDYLKWVSEHPELFI